MLGGFDVQAETQPAVFARIASLRVPRALRGSKFSVVTNNRGQRTLA